MFEIFVVVAIIAMLILAACILFFVYNIFIQNDAIEKIHFLSSENDKSVSDMNKKIKKMHDFLFKYDIKE